MSIRRETSLRANARERYRAAAEGDAALAQASAPAEPAEPSVTERARALYEDSVVPVREIARLCGVTERTLYKYAEKGHWRRRHRRLAKGAGGRFIPLAEEGKPHPTGLKALDPQGATRAGAALQRAGEISAEAQARARHMRETESSIRSLGHLVSALRDAAAVEEMMQAEAAREAEARRKKQKKEDTEASRQRLLQKLTRYLGPKQPEVADAGGAGEVQAETVAAQSHTDAAEANALPSPPVAPTEQGAPPRPRIARAGPRIRGIG
jgi:hypothetical protein